jgi:drug/metabolite transporter (DMT)-like permease
VFVGLAGVAMVVWHKIDVREVTVANLTASLIAVAAVTAATLYQKVFSPRADLTAATVVQFAATLVVVTPLAIGVEGFKNDNSAEMWTAIAFLVVFASILGVMALWWLLRHGEATRVTSMMYLPPVFAVVLELAMFDVVPGALMLAGIAVTCAGVAMTVWHKPWKSSTS